MSRGILYRVALALSLTFSIMSCGSQPGVELWVTSELRDALSITKLDFSVRDAQVQPSGFEVFADHRVTDEWEQLELLTDTIDLVEAQSQAVLVARGDVATGAYDRIFLRPTDFDGVDENGAELSIKNVMEPTVVSFSYDGSGTLQIVLEIIAIATRGDEDYSVFAKRAEAQLE
jgi:hypothetical protein